MIGFQQLDLKISQLQERTHEIPESIEALLGTLAESRNELEAAEALLGEENSRRRELELEVETLRETLSKYKSQLMEVKSNKEYQAMLKGISKAEGGIAKKEDQVLEGMMVIEEKEQLTENVKQKFRQREKEVLQKRTELEKFASIAQAQIDELQQEKGQLQAQIPEELIEQYQRIATVRNGLALAEAKDQSCQACHVKLRPQLFAEIKTAQVMITCENCNRFLYWAGMLGE
jgi:hypothetical protein